MFSPRNRVISANYGKCVKNTQKMGSCTDIVSPWLEALGELFQARGMDLLGCIRELVCVVVGSREARGFGRLR